MIIVGITGHEGSIQCELDLAEEGVHYVVHQAHIFCFCCSADRSVHLDAIVAGDRMI